MIIKQLFSVVHLCAAGYNIALMDVAEASK